MSAQVAFNIGISLAVLLVAYLLVRRGMRRAPEDGTAAAVGEALFKRVFEAAPDPTLIADSSGRITLANQQVSALFGYSKDELVGQPIELLIPDRVRHQHVQHRTGYNLAPTVRSMGAGLLLFARRKDGSEFPVEISLSPLATDAGSLVMAAVRDVSKRHALEIFRDEFLEFISHDLKNPLSVISLQSRVLAQKLAGRELSDEANAVAVISKSAAFIDGLVRELLDMAYVESEQLVLDVEPVEMCGFLKQVLDRTVSSVDRDRVRLEEGQSGVLTLIEPRRIERVVVNFLQNALKYSPAGSPIVVSVEARDGVAKVTVADQGPGLSSDEGSFVFEKYRRTASARPKEGLGLGLYISRRIVEAHGGSVGVDSTPGKGARFCFSVPLARGQAVSEPLARANGDRGVSRLPGVKLLLVDDETHAISALTTLLTEEGFIVLSATSGQEALELARAQRPDVAVLDVQMPGMSGITLVERLHDLHPSLPVIIMSGYMARHPGIAEVRGATGASYISKPVDVDELIRTVERIVIKRATGAT